MLIGAHAIISSADAQADRRFLRDVLGLSGVDAGEGWLIFGLPPAEVAVHPGEKNDEHELYLMCDDAEAFVAEMARRGVICSPAQNRGWGVVTSVPLPGGGSLGIYEPRHARPGSKGGRARKSAARRKPRSSSSRGAARKAPRRKARRS
ncbi:MAG TPA: extradiol dioxygenase [Thermoanaerobaculia bacterium]|nr:extradiol dioxygenase [Thermoanaerobaculia bacterium]